VDQDSTRLIWIDLEMTGLDSQQDRILEIATLVTDAWLDPLAEGPVIAIHQPCAVLESMDEWNRRHHGQSGLLERVKTSSADVRWAEEETLRFLQNWVPLGVSPMCGNSVCQDRRFLARWMPALEAYFHYRNLDVSTLKELARRWAPDMAQGFSKASQHLALADIYESVAELRYYRENFLHLPASRS